jgi:hypothetical protein
MANAHFKTNGTNGTDGNNGGVRRRYTKRQIEQRRLGVWEMLCLGQPIGEIAKSYKVSERTIERDVAWWKERLGRGVEALRDPENAAIDIGTAARKLDKIYEDSYVEYMASSNATVKVRLLQTAIHAIMSRQKMLADAGYLPRIGHERQETPQVQITFEQRFGKDAVETVFDDPSSRRKVLETAEALFKAGLTGGDLKQIAYEEIKPADVREVADGE